MRIEQLMCRPIPIVHKTAYYSEQTTAYEHLVNLARKEKKRKRKGGEGKRREENGDRYGRSILGARG